MLMVMPKWPDCWALMPRLSKELTVREHQAGAPPADEGHAVVPTAMGCLDGTACECQRYAGELPDRFAGKPAGCSRSTAPLEARRGHPEEGTGSSLRPRRLSAAAEAAALRP